jgi:hypothetical protein
MSETRIIRYRTKPECADENARLIRAVFAELTVADPKTVRYTAFRLDDGVSFVHLVETDDDKNPLPELAAFREFQSGIAERCVEGPTPAVASVVGSYP